MKCTNLLWSDLVIALYGNLVGQECIVPAHNRVLNETTTTFGNLLLHFLSVQELLILEFYQLE
jgi:hypothetical protein